MKKTLLILSVILLAACGKDEPKAGLESDIIGVWYAKQSYINGNWLNLPTAHQTRVEFSKDNKYGWTVGDDSVIWGTYSVSGKMVICKIMSKTHRYEVISISGDDAEFKVYMDDDVFHYKAKKLY